MHMYAYMYAAYQYVIQVIYTKRLLAPTFLSTKRSPKGSGSAMVVAVRPTSAVTVTNATGVANTI